MSSPRRVLVLGGTRFIGAALVRTLAAAGHRVTVVHRGEHEAPLPDEVKHVHLTRDELPAHARELLRTSPEVLVDMMAQTASWAKLVVDTFASHVPRLVVASSMDVYRAFERLAGSNPGPPDELPLSEEAPLREVPFPRRKRAASTQDWRYDYDKRQVEQVLTAACASQVTVLRLPFVYGPHDHRRRLQPYLAKMAEGGATIELAAAEARWQATRGYVDNVAAALALAVGEERAAGKTYNVGEALSEAQWVGRIGRAAGWSGRIAITGVASQDWEQDLVLDTRRIREDLGYREPIELDEGLRRTVRWERSC